MASEIEEAHCLESCNTDVIRLAPIRRDGDDSVLTLTLWRTTGLVERNGGIELRDEHIADLRFPRFFPAVPIEAHLQTPVFHPNVDPASGFVCLWDRFSPGDTVIGAVLRLQQVVAWKMCNVSTDHLMQPAAAAWHRAGNPGYTIPLPYLPIHLPEGLDRLAVFPPRNRNWKRRLGE